MRETERQRDRETERDKARCDKLNFLLAEYIFMKWKAYVFQIVGKREIKIGCNTKLHKLTKKLAKQRIYKFGIKLSTFIYFSHSVYI